MGKETIKQFQRLLEAIGYSPGDIDGIWGKQSQSALDAACKAHGVGIAQNATTTPTVDNPSEVDWWKTIRYFRREEFRCPCGVCGGFTVEPDRYTVEMADEIREELGAPMTIIPLTGDPHGGGSGVRCQPYNDSLKNSVPNSWHTKGKAFDFVCHGRSATVIEAVLARKQAQGKIRYWYKCGTASWHVDTGGIQ